MGDDQLIQVSDESARAEAAQGGFRRLFGSQPELTIFSPGRAEVLGNHTDYNGGFALACAISRSIVAAARRRNDTLVRLFSDSAAGESIQFDLKCLTPDPERNWGSYAKGVFAELLKHAGSIGGMEFYFTSDIPFSGGVSSSAAYELAVGSAIRQAFDLAIDDLELAVLCKAAENGPFVRVPCGLLDQASIALARRGELLFLDFAPPEGGVLGVRHVRAGLEEANLLMVIAVDFGLRRNLGDSGYPARRATCEASLPILSKLLGRQISALRHLRASEFEELKPELLKTGGRVMSNRVEHVVYENDRVLRSVELLAERRFSEFGELLSASGRSALDLYELDAETPELTSLVQIQRDAPGVLGVRNMGGGFSAVTLALISAHQYQSFCAYARGEYQRQWQRALEFIPFVPGAGVAVIDSA